MTFEPLSDELNLIGDDILDSAFAVHRALGAGLYESVYEVCFCHELEKRGLTVARQVVVPIQYDGHTFEEGFRADVVVADKVICELKAAEGMLRIWDAQIMTYLRLMGKRLGYIINFNVPLLKDGIKRIVI